jgi:imidazolonepropionase-like amidohydrolase
MKEAGFSKALAGIRPGRPYLLRTATLIDGLSPEPSADAVVSVEADGRIGAVDCADAFGSQAIDAIPVPVLMPGLVDCHAHVTLPAHRKSIPEDLRVSDARLALTSVRQLGRHLAAGFTTVRDCGARGTTAFDVRSAVADGDIVASRLLVCGRAITHSGGHLSWCGSVADGPEEVQREVRVLASEGADAIKLIASGGSTGGVPFRAGYTVDELVAAVAAAHGQGLSTIAHCRSTDSIANCVVAGIDVIAHLEFLVPGPVEDFGGGAPTGLPCFDPAVGRALAEARPWLDLNPQSSGWDTVVELRLKASERPLDRLEAQRLHGLERYFEGMLGVIRSLCDLGLVDRMAFGTDAGPFDTEFGHPEYGLELARSAGLTPMQAIQALTSNPAAACSRGDMVGSIRPGAHADLLVLARDPLKDPMALRSVLAVLLSGRRVA